MANMLQCVFRKLLISLYTKLDQRSPVVTPPGVAEESRLGGDSLSPQTLYTVSFFTMCNFPKGSNEFMLTRPGLQARQHGRAVRTKKRTREVFPGPLLQAE
jgi:hypothetical protein